MCQPLVLLWTTESIPKKEKPYLVTNSSAKSKPAADMFVSFVVLRKKYKGALVHSLRETNDLNNPLHQPRTLLLLLSISENNTSVIYICSLRHAK